LLTQPKFRNINLHNATHSLVSRNPRERIMFVVQISLLIVTFLSLTSRILSLMHTTKEVNPHPRIVPCVNMWSVFFFFLCHLLNVGACICPIARVNWSELHHITPFQMLHFVLFHSVTCYTNSIVSRVHINTTKLQDTMCTLVAIGVILRSLECTKESNFKCVSS
jgi:hypothetical protein